MKRFAKASNQSTIKTNNKSLILNILNSREQISRVELSRITGLTKTSITNIVNELVEQGIMQEIGKTESLSGRKPTLLALNKNSMFALGIYISRDFACCNAANLRGEILYQSRHDFSLSENKETFLNSIYTLLDDVLGKTKIPHNKILGAGIASIGPLDIKNGVILDPPNFKGLKNIPIVEAISSKYGIRTFLDNDMNAGAIAEKLFGEGRNYANFVYIGVCNGIGGGIVLDGHILKGSGGFAGEIGHTSINISGDKCSCGNLGCVELYASIPVIVKQIETSIELGACSCLKQEEISWPSIIEAARKGDNLCKKALEKLVFYLSQAIVNTVNTFDPELIFLGHDIALAEDLIIGQLNEIVNDNILFKNYKSVNVKVSTFREKAPFVGAPSIVLNKFFTGELF